MRKVGVCYFDDPKTPGYGWSSVAGAPAQRVNGHGELRSDVLWVLNIKLTDLTRLGLNRTNHLYDEQYFRIALKQLAQELGLTDDPETFVQYSSEILDRVARLGKDGLGVSIDNPGYRYMTLISDRHMPDFNKKKPVGPFSASILDAVRQSTQENQAMTGRYAPAGSTAQSFVFPRGSYGRWILSQPVPSCDNWREFKLSGSETIIGNDEGAEIKGTKHVLERLKIYGEENALFMRVNVMSSNKSNRNFATFGAGANYPRMWATLPEVLELVKYSRISISNGFMTPLRENPFSKLINMEVDEISYSRSLLIENLWVSLATNISTTKRPTPIGAYLRAYDRATCLKMAEIFEGYTYCVGSFGVGRVIVYLRAGEINHATDLAIQHGMLPTTSLLRGR